MPQFLTIAGFTELTETFGFNVAILIVLAVVLFKLTKGVIDHLADRGKKKEEAYEELVAKVQKQNEEREVRYEKTIQDNLVIIKNLSESFDVLKDVLVKVEDIEAKVSEISSSHSVPKNLYK